MSVTDGFGDDAVGNLARHLWWRAASRDGQVCVVWGPDMQDIFAYRAKAKLEAHTQMLRDAAAKVIAAQEPKDGNA